MDRNDARWIIAVTTVVVALFGSAWITTNVMITLAGVVREDLHELRDTSSASPAASSPRPRLPATIATETERGTSWTRPPGPSSPRRSCC